MSYGTKVLWAAWAAVGCEGGGMYGEVAEPRVEDTYVAALTEVNPTFTPGDVVGEARITFGEAAVRMVLDARGLPPETTILAHFHGFTEGDRDAACPDPALDANQDGVVDLIETRDAAGVTLVPFSDAPATLEIVGATYPRSDAEGELHYDQTVPLGELERAFRQAYPGQSLDLSRRVVFLHGVPETASVPESAQSLEGVPARVTLPIACGPLRLSE
jgi:hypothetical protein